MTPSWTERLADPWRGADPADPAVKDDPYSAYAPIREHEPVSWTPEGTVRLMRHADVARLLKEVKVGVRTTQGVLPFTDESLYPRRFLLQRDPPDHTRLRRLVSRAFAAPAVARMRSDIEQLVDELLEPMLEARRACIIRDLALPLPSAVICKMMGVPVEDRDLFTTWTAQATHALLGDRATPEVRQTAIAAAMSLLDYFDRLLRARGPAPRDDLIGHLVQREADGDELSAEELMTHLIGLLVAGFETTIGLIGNGVRQLLLHPGEWQRLRADPALAETAVEECLRFDGPIVATRRVLHEDATFQGERLPANTVVDAIFASAHRDPRAFPDPERFDVGRTPNPHFAFGGGAHFCLGAHLARLEARAALVALARRTRSLELASERVEWGPSLFRVPRALEVRVEPA